MENRYIKYGLLVLFASLIFISCDKDKDLRAPEEKELENIEKINELLQYNIWGFNDLVIDVESEMRAIPLLVNVADENGMVQPGQYDAIDIYGNSHRQEYYEYQFMNSSIYLDSMKQGDYTKFAAYQVLRSKEMTINYDSSTIVRYSYEYLDSEGLFTMTSNKLGNSKINKVVNAAITKAIISGKPK